MSSETKSKKRKALMPDDEVAKSKKIKPTTSDVISKKRKVVTETDPIATKKSKVPKSTNTETSNTIATEKITAAAKVLTKNGKIKNGLKGKDKQGNEQATAPAESLSVSDSEVEDAVGDFDEQEVDDQTEALIKGFESEDDGQKVPEDRGYEAGQKIPKLDKNTKNQAKAAREAATSDKPGVIYVGRIPHGFYEQEMRQYFSQFGDISNLRLSRNRKTGSSKHFAFIEFESAEVAEIVSKTMDNYLLFGHILKCKMVAPEQVHQSLWQGANKRFKKVPWNKMEGRKLKQGMTEEAWNKRIEREEIRRAKKKEALKSMGYEFKSPKVKSAKDVAKEKEQSLIATTNCEPSPEETKAIEAPHLSDDHASGKEPAESGKNKKITNFDAGNAVELISKLASNTQDSPALEETPSKQQLSDTKGKKANQELDGSRHNVQPQFDKNVDFVEGDKFAKVKKSRKSKAL